MWPKRMWMWRCWAPSSAAERFANDAEGHSALAAALQPLGVALVVMEATGGYEARWPARCKRPGCRSRWSTRARRATLPSRWGAWPRPTASTPHAGRVGGRAGAPRRSGALPAPAAQCAAAASGGIGHAPAPAAHDAAARSASGCSWPCRGAPKHRGHDPSHPSATRRRRGQMARPRARALRRTRSVAALHPRHRPDRQRYSDRRAA